MSDTLHSETSKAEAPLPAAASRPNSGWGRRARRFLPLAVALLAGAGAAGWALNGKAPEKTAAISTDMITRPVQVQTISLKPLVQSKLLVGTVRARIETDQGFRVAGKIASRKVSVGDRVKAGMVLASVDATDYRLNRESAEAELEAARSAARQAELELERITELRRKGWSTDQAADRQRAARDEATGRVRRAERQVELTTNTQGYTELRAEADGIVTAIQAEIGQVVAAGQTIIRIARDGDREALVALPEQDLPLARQGVARGELWSEPGRQFGAELRELSPNADAGTRTFAARFTLKGLPADAPLGMTATISLAPPETRKVARIPLSAILNEGQGPEVFVVDRQNGVLERRKVELDVLDARDAVIRGGLADGDVVVTLGVHTLRAGQKVRTLTEAKQG